MSEVLGIRLQEDELELVRRATELQKEPGDRGGQSAWARKVILREAARVVATAPLPPPPVPIAYTQQEEEDDA